jgi:2-dehydropantoate 2-reductase
MKIGVLGAGAIGSFFGGLLARHYGPENVILVGRGAHAEKVRSRGYLLLSSKGRIHKIPVRFELAPDALKDAELVLFCVKSHATAEALRQAHPYLKNATVIAIQNGICDYLFTEWIPQERLLAATTSINVALVAPGEVTLQLDGITMLGPMFSQATDAARKAKSVLLQAGLRISFTPEIHGVRYTKLGINAVGYVSCLSASNFISEGLLYPDWRRQVAIPLLKEILDVYRAAAIKPRPIPGRSSLTGLARICHTLDIPCIGGFVGWVLRQFFNRRPIIFSLYQDLLAGKKTEVEFIHGEIVRLAKQSACRAPLNELVIDLVHELESQPSATFFSREEIIDRFSTATGTAKPVSVTPRKESRQ